MVKAGEEITNAYNKGMQAELAEAQVQRDQGKAEGKSPYRSDSAGAPSRLAPAPIAGGVKRRADGITPHNMQEISRNLDRLDE